jgi:hypothetical protein
VSQVFHLPLLELKSLLLSYNSALLNANTLRLNYSKNFKAYYNQRRDIDLIMLLILSLVILRFLLENIWGMMDAFASGLSLMRYVDWKLLLSMNMSFAVDFVPERCRI